MPPSTPSLELPNIPWEDRPVGKNDVVWRYSKNPIIPRDLIPTSNSIFNSAVVPFNGSFAGVFRCDDKCRHMDVHRGFSQDGMQWKIDENVIDWVYNDPDCAYSQYKYDPRVCWIEDRYYIMWCNGFHGPTIGIGYTYDFEKFYFLENALLPLTVTACLSPARSTGNMSCSADRAIMVILHLEISI